MLAMKRSSFRDELSLELNHYGYEVIIASDGFEALSKLRKHIIDGLVVELNLTLCDAIELILNLKEFQHNIPVVVVSFSDYYPREDILKAGATSFLRIPVNVRTIIRQLENINQVNQQFRKINK